MLPIVSRDFDSYIFEIEDPAFFNAYSVKLLILLGKRLNGKAGLVVHKDLFESCKSLHLDDFFKIADDRNRLLLQAAQAIQPRLGSS